MPPKANKAADKAKAAAKQKVVDDKTFGLKNKNKSSKVQQYVEQVKKSTVNTNTNKANRVAQMAGQVNVKDKKKAEEERQRELNALFAVAIKQPKVPDGVDPKSIVCEFYRHGQCTKGFKCKFSHDLSVERKGAKADLFTDQREVKGEDEEGMEDWDQETLERVVKEKHGSEKPTNITNIICKFFLDAVERKQYGWFWKCPNGGDCKYRHALPAGYVLKSQMKELLEEEAKNQRDVADVIEEERAKVDARTPITEEVFRVWRSKKSAERRKRLADAEEDRKRKGIMTGREIFMQEGFTVEDDASAADDYIREGADDEEKAIREMLDRAREAAARAKEAAAQDPYMPVQQEADEEGEEEEGEAEEGQQGSGSQGDAGAGPSQTFVNEDDADLFMDDDDEDDLNEDELDELAADLESSQLGT